MQKQEFEEMVGQRVTAEFYNVVEKAYMAEDAKYFFCGHDFVEYVFGDKDAQTWEGMSLAGKGLDVKLAEYLRGMWIHHQLKARANYTSADKERIRKQFRAYTKSLLHYDSTTADTVERLVA